MFNEQLATNHLAQNVELQCGAGHSLLNQLNTTPVHERVDNHVEREHTPQPHRPHHKTHDFFSGGLPADAVSPNTAVLCRQPSCHKSRLWYCTEIVHAANTGRSCHQTTVLGPLFSTPRLEAASQNLNSSTRESTLNTPAQAPSAMPCPQKKPCSTLQYTTDTDHALF